MIYEQSFDSYTEKCEDTKGATRSCTPKDRQYNTAKRKMTKRQTMIYRAIHRKLKVEQRKPH